MKRLAMVSAAAKTLLAATLLLHCMDITVMGIRDYGAKDSDNGFTISRQNVVDGAVKALKETGGYMMAALVLPYLAPIVLQTKTTLFIPSDEAVRESLPGLQASMMALEDGPPSFAFLRGRELQTVAKMHGIRSANLSYADLQELPSGTLLPTLLGPPTHYVRLSASTIKRSSGPHQHHLLINNARIEKPDLCPTALSSYLTCHGITSLLFIPPVLDTNSTSYPVPAHQSSYPTPPSPSYFPVNKPNPNVYASPSPPPPMSYDGAPPLSQYPGSPYPTFANGSSPYPSLPLDSHPYSSASGHSTPYLSPSNNLSSSPPPSVIPSSYRSPSVDSTPYPPPSSASSYASPSANSATNSPSFSNYSSYPSPPSDSSSYPPSGDHSNIYPSPSSSYFRSPPSMNSSYPPSYNYSPPYPMHYNSSQYPPLNVPVPPLMVPYSASNASSPSTSSNNFTVHGSPSPSPVPHPQTSNASNPIKLPKISYIFLFLLALLQI
ncbi:hypothetical protein KP509_13G011900 [Ceratopteris richardii]|uniref:FAS1 domain-containing protein n=1 Tax=Ceratopteris richardii TaxID=49495 RepID=A0A8T2TDM2_CERRI|nr:hypothetical protein KP509_13G011900 [Ceratopteris richardii]